MGIANTEIRVELGALVRDVVAIGILEKPDVWSGGGNHAVIVERLEKLAARKKIPLQHEAASRSTGTDTDVIFLTRGGIPSALVSLPNRYMHSPVEVISLKDLALIPELFAAFALSLKKDEEFKVKI